MDDPETIGHLNADGVALAAIQGLAEELDNARDELEAKDDRIEHLETENEALRRRLARIEERLGIDETTSVPADD